MMSIPALYRDYCAAFAIQSGSLPFHKHPISFLYFSSPSFLICPHIVSLSFRCRCLVLQSSVSSSGRQHLCDACKLEFARPEALTQHLRQHISCSQCSFHGLPEVVRAHQTSVRESYNMSPGQCLSKSAHHEPVLYQIHQKRWAYDEEEVAAWRAARRRCVACHFHIHYLHQIINSSADPRMITNAKSNVI